MSGSPEIIAMRLAPAGPETRCPARRPPTVDVDPRMAVEVGATLRTGNAALHQKVDPLVADTGPHQHEAVDLSLWKPVVCVDLSRRVLHRVQQQIEAVPVSAAASAPVNSL